MLKKTKALNIFLFFILLFLSFSNIMHSMALKHTLYRPLSLKENIPSGIEALCWSPDSRYLAVSYTDIIALWDTETGTCMYQFEKIKASKKSCHEYTFFMEWIKGGFFLAVYSLTKLYSIYDITKGQAIYQKKLDRYSIAAASLHPTEDIMCHIIQQTDFSYDFCIENRSRKRITLLLRRTYPIYHAEWNHEGTKLVTSTEHGSIYIFEYPSNNLFCRVHKHRSSINGFSWSPNDKKLASYDETGELNIWKIVRPNKEKLSKEAYIDLLLLKEELSGCYSYNSASSSMLDLLDE